MSEVYCEKCGSIVQPKDHFCRKCGSSLDSKIVVPESTQSVQPKRGGCLTFMLVGMLTVNPLIAIFYFINVDLSTNHSLSNTPAWIIPVFGIIGVANFIFAFAIWKWKKWGMYGLAGVSVIGFIINAPYIDILSSLLGFANVVTLAFLLRNAWNQME